MLFQNSKELFLNPPKTFSTGSSRLDEEIGRISLGMHYLFYGEWDILEKLLYSVLVNYIRETNSEALLLTGFDYHMGSFLDFYDLGYIAVQYWLDPIECMKKIYVLNLFNKRQTLHIDEIEPLISKVKLIVLYGVTNLYRYENYPMLIKFLSKIKCLLNNGTIIFFSSPRKSRKYPPPPDGPLFFRHLPNIIVYFKRVLRVKNMVRAYVLKHPFRANRTFTLMIYPYGLE